MAELNNWNVTAANNNSAPPNGWPENTMQYSEVNDTAREGMAVMARYFKDTNGSLVAAGTANAYTLTLNAGYSAYFAGMYIACQIPATNTGASTINVNTIGVASIVNRSGGALGAGELQSGGIYEFRYDGTNFQLMGTVTGGSVTASGVRIVTDIATATPPTTELVSGYMEIYDADQTDALALVGYNGTSILRVANLMHGGGVALQGQNNAGASQLVFDGDPDGASNLYNAGSVTASTATAAAGGLLVTQTVTAAGAERVMTVSDNALKANLASPTFTGTPLAPTAATATNTTQLATTAYCVARIAQDIAVKANLASPALTGTPTAPTAATATNSTQIATTAYCVARIAQDIAVKANVASPTFTGVPAAPTAVVGTNTTQLATTAYCVAEIGSRAPTKTGGGASGTWAISISGNAATATSATTAGSATTATSATSATSATNATNAANFAVSDESTDTTCFVVFTTGASGNLPGKTGTNLTFNSSTGELAATQFSGTLVGNGASVTNLNMANAATGTLAVLRGGTGTTTSTGTGSTVLSASPVFAGTPTAPTATTATNNTQLATTAYCVARIAQDIAVKADLASPTFTGVPAAPTATTATNTTQLATTAYCVARIAQDITGKANLASPTFTGVPAAPTATTATNTTQLATTAYCVARIAQDIAGKANLASPAFTGTVTGTALTFTGQIQGGSFNQSSDLRLKENIYSFVAGSIQPGNIRAVHYDFIDGKKNQIGYIAQEVQETLFDAVIVDPQTGYMSVDYNMVHTAKIAALEDIIADLTDRLSRLEK